MVSYLSPCWSLYTYDKTQYDDILDNLNGSKNENLVVTGNGLRKASTFDWWYGFLSNVILNSGKMSKMSTRQHLEMGRFLRYGLEKGFVKATDKVFTDFVKKGDLEDIIEMDSKALEGNTSSFKKSLYSGYSKIFISKKAKEELQNQTDNYLVRIIEREDLNQLHPVKHINTQYNNSFIETKALAVITPIFWAIANMLGKVNFDEATYTDVKATIKDMEYSTATNKQIYDKPELNSYHKMILERAFKALEPVVVKQPHAKEPLDGVDKSLKEATKDRVVKAFYDTITKGSDILHDAGE
jgi:hypothetical protein